MLWEPWAFRVTVNVIQRERERKREGERAGERDTETQKQIDK